MAYERLDESPLNYNQCRYGRSKLLFRGPRRSLKQDYFAFIGGSETYGKYVEKPFVDQVEEATGTICANFSAINAGVDAFVNEPSLMGLCGRAKATVVQVMGAQNMSNRFYTVHPRRNDRFLKASVMLQTIFREVDFTEFSFTRHMLSALKTVSPQRFAAVEMELRTAWLSRMELMLGQIGGRRILLWLREPSCEASDACLLGPDPLFLDKPLIMRLEHLVDEIVEIDATGARGVLEGMHYNEMERPAAEQMIGLDLHRTIAERLVEIL